MGRHEILETVAIADCAMQIGDDLDDLFATAATAVAELMVDPATVPLTVERRVTLTAPALDLLMHDWLSELIYLKDSERLVFVKEMEERGIVVRAASRSGLAEEAGLAHKDLDEVVDVVHRLDLAREVVSLHPIGNIKG